MTAKITDPELIRQRSERDKEKRRKYRQRIAAEREQARLEAKAEQEQEAQELAAEIAVNALPAIVSAAAEPEMEPQKLRVLLRDRDLEKFSTLKKWVNAMACAVDDLDSSRVWRLYRDRAAVMRDRSDCEMAAHYLGSKRFYVARVVAVMKGES